jgi:hypothetical protein
LKTPGNVVHDGKCHCENQHADHNQGEERDFSFGHNNLLWGQLIILSPGFGMVDPDQPVSVQNDAALQLGATA